MKQVELQTSLGTIVLELDEDKAPKTVENFLGYVRSGFYTNTIFHRVIRGFMIQGGGLDTNMNQKKTDAPVQYEGENGLKNDQYTVAMARTSDPQSATAQFFINGIKNDFLNHGHASSGAYGYTVFGKVILGEEVVNKIIAVKTRRVGYHDDVPIEPITILGARLIG